MLQDNWQREGNINIASVLMGNALLKTTDALECHVGAHRIPNLLLKIPTVTVSDQFTTEAIPDSGV